MARLSLRRRLASGGEGSAALRLWTYLCVLVSVFAITAHEDFGALRYTMAGLVTAGFLLSWHRRRRRNLWVKVILSVGCLWAAWNFLRALTVDPFHTSIPLTVFLLWLQTLHSYDLPRRRDLLFSLLTSVVLMAVAAAFSVDLTYGAFFAPYALAACVALLYNTADAGREAALASMAPPAATPVLRGVEALPTGAALLVVLALVGGVVFLLTPRLPGLFITTLPFTPTVPVGDRFSGGIVNPAYPQTATGETIFNPNGYFGFGPSVDLRVRGRLNDAVVMRVRTTERRNWRGLVFDTYTGTGWRIDDHRVRQHTSAVPPIALVHGRDDVYAYRDRERRVVQTFYIQRDQPNVAFAVPRVEHIYLPGDHVYVDRYSSVRLPFTLDRGMIYTVVSRPLDPSPLRLQGAGEAYPRFILERYLQLPPGVTARTHTLAREITAPAATPYDRVQAVNRYLWRQYAYDLSIGPQRRPGDAVDYFLFEERRGYCEQFASAMVVLLRSVGVPARLATGYTPGTVHPLTGLLEIRNSDAHAWVEVFFPGTGWVEFEPTPSFPDPAALGGPGVPRWGWQGVTEYLSARLGTVTPPRWLMAALLPLARAAPWMLGAGVLTAVLLLGRTLRPVAPRGAEREVLAAYTAMLRRLARRGLRRAAAETPREFAERAGDLPGVATLTGVVEEALFAPGGATPEMAAAARTAARALRSRSPR
jgi:transglutaminase-like putative cysteine protease